MTEKEIIKAKELIKMLQEAYTAYYDTSKGMPYNIDEILRESAFCLENCVKEINRQQAEIERYEEDIERLRTAFIQEVTDRDNAKADAIKEFKEKLRDLSSESDLYDRNERWVQAVTIDEINETYKEMVGEQE